MVDIETAKQGVELCNRHIRKIEEQIEIAQAGGDIQTVSRLEWALVKWAERLSYFIKQARELGETKTDVTQALKEGAGKMKRFNAKDSDDDRRDSP